MRLELTSGSNVTRSVIANAARCINLYPERNSRDAPVPMTYYQRPGLRPLVQAAEGGPVRGLYRASNGQGYAVIAQSLYAVTAAWGLLPLGQLAAPLTTPVSMIDNGSTLLLADTSAEGYSVALDDLTGTTFTTINDPTGTFAGATRLDYIDTFVLWAPTVPGSNLFGSTLSNEIVFDGLYQAGKTDYPDPLVTLVVNRHEILLLGTLKSEIWYDAGNAQFPFAELPGAYVEFGCAAPFSPAHFDINVYWLAQSLEGQGLVMRQRGYLTQRVSNHPLEFAIQKMLAAGTTVSDAIGMVVQQAGHAWYILAFPSGNQTWAFDESTEEWHQLAWTDANGLLQRHRANCAAFINGQNVVGDWQNGTLYALDWNVYTDTLAPGGAAGPITFLKGFPHFQAVDSAGRQVLADGQTIRVKRVMADIDVGGAQADLDGTSPPQVGLRWSEDRGHTFGQTVLEPAGALGQFVTRPTWQGSTGYGRDIIYELSHSIPGPAALNGVWVDADLAK